MFIDVSYSILSWLQALSGEFAIADLQPIDTSVSVLQSWELSSQSIHPLHTTLTRGLEHAKSWDKLSPCILLSGLASCERMLQYSLFTLRRPCTALILNREWGQLAMTHKQLLASARCWHPACDLHARSALRSDCTVTITLLLKSLIGDNNHSEYILLIGA